MYLRNLDSELLGDLARKTSDSLPEAMRKSRLASTMFIYIKDTLFNINKVGRRQDLNTILTHRFVFRANTRHTFY
jgi:hypothetical protein